MPQQPARQPHDPDYGEKENCEQCDTHAKQEHVVFPGVSARLMQVARHESIVAPVRLPGDVKGIAHDWNRPYQHLHRDIYRHPRQANIGDAPKPCRNDDDARGESSKYVSEPRNEPDDSIQTEAYRGSREPKPVVEYMRQQVEIFIRKPATANPHS